MSCENRALPRRRRRYCQHAGSDLMLYNDISNYRLMHPPGTVLMVCCLIVNAKQFSFLMCKHFPDINWVKLLRQESYHSFVNFIQLWKKQFVLVSRVTRICFVFLSSLFQNMQNSIVKEFQLKQIKLKFANFVLYMHNFSK